MFKSIYVGAAIAMITSGVALAEAPMDANALGDKARGQLECTALYGVIAEPYPENWQTLSRERMRDAFALLRSTGRQNLARSGSAGESADPIIQARVEEIVKLAEGEAKTELRRLFNDCSDLYRKTLHGD